MCRVGGKKRKGRKKKEGKKEKEGKKNVLCFAILLFRLDQDVNFVVVSNNQEHVFNLLRISAVVLEPRPEGLSHTSTVSRFDVFFNIIFFVCAV